MGLNNIKINNTTNVKTGIVYDISKATGQSYETLSDALGTDGENVPSEVREGGMSIRFVHTGDNKYVQFRLTSQNWSTDPDDWQDEDAIITGESPNTDLSFDDENNNAIAQFSGGHIKTKNFDSRNVISPAERLKLAGIEARAEVNNTETEESANDFAISDENDNNIVEFLNGEVKTKNFNSRTTPNEKPTEIELVDFSVADKKDNNILQIIQGNIRTKKFDSKDLWQKVIVAIGDSITMGANGDTTEDTDNPNTHLVFDAVCSKVTSLGLQIPSLKDADRYRYDYCSWLRAFTNYKVKNYGVGGETAQTIFARCCNIPAKLPINIVLPSTITDVTIASDDTETPYYLESVFDDNAVKPLLQDEGVTDKTVNPCFIDGIELNMSVSVNSGKYTWKVRRVSQGDRNVNIEAGTIICMSGYQKTLQSDIAIIFVGTNRDADDNQNLVELIERAVNNLRTKKFIIISRYAFIDAQYQTVLSQEEELEEKFGMKYLNFRKWAVYDQNIYKEFGITPTSYDVTEMEHGRLGTAFISDGTHLNAAGHGVLALAIYNRMKCLYNI